MKREDNLSIEENKDQLFTHKTLEERAAEYGGDLKLDGEFDFGKEVGREAW